MNVWCGEAILFCLVSLSACSGGGSSGSGSTAVSPTSSPSGRLDHAPRHDSGLHDLFLVRRHYDGVARRLAKLDVELATTTLANEPAAEPLPILAGKPTAVVLVTSF